MFKVKQMQALFIENEILLRTIKWEKTFPFLDIFV